MPSTTPPEPVAIIGIALRLPPDIDTPVDFWKFCTEARCSAAPIPRSRFDARNLYHPNALKQGHFNVSAGSYLDADVSLFDAPYFNLTEAEATAMDPQQRLLLETVVHAIENAGLDMNALAGRSDVGVFAASSKSEYESRVNQDLYTASRYAAVGTAATMFANRISYFFNLRGPSINIDTACSSSLTALHLAVQSIRKGECSSAIVGCSFLQLSPSLLAYMGNLGALSKDGISYSFDARANGYGRSDGVCCIILKSSSEATRCFDTVMAHIRGTGINHCGRSAGITVPNGAAQLDLIHQVYREAQLSPDDTDFVEGHGTGTSRGDPIEVESITSAFCGPGRNNRPLYLGSIKSNFGHLENASGLLSVIKCVLMLQRGVILPNANFKSFNPEIKLKGCHLVVPTECIPWPLGVRRASINNFGFGGSNGHVILEHFAQNLDPIRQVVNGGIPAAPHLFPVSAKDTTALSSGMKNLAAYVDTNQEGDEEDFIRQLSHTLCCRRTLYDHQFAAVASSKAELVERLLAPFDAMRRASTHSIAMIFTGQGAAYSEMGLSLMEYPMFAEKVKDADSFLRTQLGSVWSLLDELAKPVEISNLQSAAISQPATTALQIALFSLLRSWGMEPTAVCGHSSGEIAAAYAASIIDMEAALALAYYRGQATISRADCNQLPEGQRIAGSMMAVGASASQVEPLIQSLASGLISIACYNSAESVTVSGDECAITELQQQLNKLGLFYRVLKVDLAYHSDHMIPLAQHYLDAVTPWLHRTRRTSRKAKASVFSTVTGSQVDAKVMQSPWYWTTNLVRPVRFHEALKCLLASSSGSSNVAMVEIGPHGALAGPIRDIFNESAASLSFKTKYLSVMKRQVEPHVQLLSMASDLICQGFHLDLATISRSNASKATETMLPDLPNYSFNRARSYWHSSRLAEAFDHGGTPWNVILGHRNASVGGAVEFRNVFTLDDIPWLRDHKVNGNVVFPLAGYISMVVEALALTPGAKSAEDTFRLRELVVGKALNLVEGVYHEMFTLLRPYMPETRSAGLITWHTFEIWSWSDSMGFCEHCKGLAVAQKPHDDTVSDNTVRRHQIMERFRSGIESRSHRPIAANALYRRMSQVGLAYGPSFSLLTRLHTGIDAAVGTVELGDTTTHMPEQYESRLILHPTLLDACLHAGCCNLAGNPGELAGLSAHVPTFIESIVISPKMLNHKEPDELQAYFHFANKDNISPRSTTGNMTCFAKDMNLPVIEVRNLRMVDVSDGSSSIRDSDAINPAKLEWLEHPHFLTTDAVKALEGADHGEKYALGRRVQELEDLSLQYLRQALHQPLEKTSLAHLELLKAWMHTAVSQSDQSIPATSELLPFPECRGHDSEATPWSSELFVHRAGSQLVAVLNEKTDPLTVLQDSGLSRVYEESFTFQESAALLARAVNRLSLQNPFLRILEVGAGTGGFTSRILEQLSSSEPSRFSSYTYTDISSVFLGPAQAKFAAWSDKMVFKTLDLGRDAVSQGFQESDFDLIIAADVVHATPSVGVALSILRSLLKSNGVLALAELSRSSLFTFPFAMLPGWWARPTGPILSRDEWHKELIDAQFSGIDAHVLDFPDGRDIHCVILSHACTATPQTKPLHLTVVGQSSLGSDLAKNDQLHVQFRAWESVGDAAGIAVIEEDTLRPFLLTMCEEKQTALKQLYSNMKGIFWITRSTNLGIESVNADFVLGFARSLRKEYSQVKTVVLQLGKVDDSTASRFAADVLRHAFVVCPGIDESEVDFKLVEECLRYPRLMADRVIRGQIEKLDSRHTDEQPFWQAPTALRATMGCVGLVDTLHLERASGVSLMGQIEDDKLLIEVHATGMNFKDILIALGRVPWSHLGKECSGVVIATGKTAAQSFSPGDRVVHWGDGLFASHALCHVDTVAKIPTGIGLGFSEAASIPIVFTTAYESLINCAKIQPGEKLLIHAAAGGVGQAAIQLAQWIGGVEIYCTVGSPEKRDVLIEKYGIEASHIFSSRSPVAFSESLQLVMLGQGFDVILNSLSGEMLRESWHALAPFGRFIEVGKRDALVNSALEMSPLDKAVSYIAVDLSLLIAHRTTYAKQLLNSVLELFDTKQLRCVQPILSVCVSEIDSGLRLMQSGKHTGKIVVCNNRDARVKVASSLQPSGKWKVRHDASYWITGGTGGLGRFFARWLISKGAKRIILTSRTGRINQATDEEKLHEFAAKHDAEIMIAECDIRSKTEVESIVARAAAPIRGVIHGAMVLKDALFEMSQPEDWDAVVQPKVQGALNLHHAFSSPSALDFFLCLSSLASMGGNVGQSSYAGANAFMDALCVWRGTQGLPATSINLPSISDAGYVADAMASGQVTFTDLVYGSAMSTYQLGNALSAILDDESRCNQYTLGLSQTQHGMDLLRHSGSIFLLIRLPFIDQGGKSGRPGLLVSKDGEVSVKSLVIQAASADAKRVIVQESMVKKIARTLMIPEVDVQPERAIVDLGLDSLVAVELRNWIVRELDANVAVMDIVGCPSLGHLVAMAAERSSLLR